MASRRSIDPDKLVLQDIPLKFLSNKVMHTLFAFPKDSLPKTVIKANRLDDQVLVKYYRKGWRRYGP
jgi:predicted membrane-bound spermidine synthase